jgi:hypothetical protein
MPNPRVLRARRFYEVAALSAVRKTPAGLAPAGVETIAFKAMEEDENSVAAATNGALTSS